ECLSVKYERGGETHTLKVPLIAVKVSVYEVGILYPMIVKWPKVVKAGSVMAQPVIIEDFFPSILDMAQINNPTTIQKVDGKSFVPLLRGQESADKDRLLVWHSPNKWTKEDGPGINFFSAARQGKWKLVYDYRRQKLELYDLEKDLGEQSDLAKKEKKV